MLPIAQAALAPVAEGGRLLLMGLGLALALTIGACSTTSTSGGSKVASSNQVPGATEGDAKMRASVRLQLATSYYQSGQLQLAIETANKAIELDPDSAAAHGLLGLLLLDLGQIKQADASFQRALAIDRENPDINNNYGWFLCQTGHELDSVQYFERAFSNRLYESPARALQNAGICLLRVHEDKRAEKLLLQSLSADATNPVVKFQLAQMYLHQRRFDRCDFYFDLLVRSVEANAETLWLGVRIAHAKKDAAAEKSYAEQLQMRFSDSPQADAMHRGRFDD